MTGFLVALAISAALGLPVLAILRRWRVVDVPGHRSSHVVATPRGGGIAVAGGLIAGLSTASVSGSQVSALAVGIGCMGLLGLADDLRRIDAPMRLGCQALLALAPLPWLLKDVTGSGAWQVIFTAGVWLWLIAYVNAYNFMDGINGLALAQAIVVGATWWLLGSEQSVAALEATGAILVGAALGFAPFNFPRARMFLGDVGSYMIGAWIAVGVVIGLRAGITPVSVIAPVSLFLADTGMTIARRIRRGERWYEAHRSHAYQRLVIAGWSHARTTFVATFVMLLVSLIGWAALGTSTWSEIAAWLTIAVVLGGYFALAGFVERRARRLGTRS